jgi:hypothetical protein
LERKHLISRQYDTIGYEMHQNSFRPRRILNLDNCSQDCNTDVKHCVSFV